VARVESFVALSVLTAGTLPPNPQEMLSRQSFAQVSSALEAEYDVWASSREPPLFGAHPDAKLVLSGFTDATGSAEKNAELAKTRAQAVRDALKAAGVAEDRIVLKKPESITGGADAKEARRVEISPAA